MFGPSPSRLGAYTSLYAAAAPMSIFGSLGVVKMGFNTLVACFSFGGIEGAKIIGNMGFELLLDSVETAELSSNSLFPVLRQRLAMPSQSLRCSSTEF